MKKTLSSVLFENDEASGEVYPLEKLGLYKRVDGEDMSFYLSEPNQEFVGVVTLSNPDKHCNGATQVKFVALDKRYQGRGYGSYLYKLAGIVAQRYMNKDGITSDHTESTTSSARSVWDNMIPNKFDVISSKMGNSKFDYTGRETPNDPDDDCTLTGVGAPATDYAWKIKPETAAEVDAMMKKQLGNAKKFGPIPSYEFAERDYVLWSKSYINTYEPEN